MRTFFTICIFLLLPLMASSQTYQNFNQSNSGIYFDSNYDIAFDGVGNIWISSLRDGVGFTGISKLSADLTTWKTYFDDQLMLAGDNRVRYMAVDKDNNIWLSARAGGTSIIKADGTIMSVDSLAGIYSRTVFEDKDGKIYVSTRPSDRLTARIWVTDDLGVSWEKWTLNDIGIPLSEADARPEAYDIEYDSQGNMWLCTHYGVSYRNTSNVWASITELDDAFTNFMAIGAGDNVWIPDGVSQAVWQVKSDLTVTTHDNLLGLDSSNTSITDITADMYGNVWFTTDQEGLFMVDTELNLSQYTVENTAGGLVQDVLYVAKAQDSVLWLSTDDGGVVRVSNLVTALEDGLPTFVSGYKLRDNYPNPFNPETTIEFELLTKTDITLAVYNLNGQKVKTLAAGSYGAGVNSIKWNGTDNSGNQLSSGVYIYRLTGNGFDQSKKMILIK